MGISNCVETVAQDARCACRNWLKNPYSVAAMVLTLALGIGVNVALFAVLDTLLWASPAVRDPAEIVEVRLQESRGSRDFSYGHYQTLRGDNAVLRGLSAYTALTLTSQLGLARVNVVSSNYFTVLGGQFAIGRGFQAEDERASGVPTAALTYRAWQRYFGGNQAVLGRTVRLAGITFTIIGVTGRGFGGLDPKVPDFWVPMGMRSALESRNVPGEGPDLPPPLTVFGRLAPRVSIRQARAALSVSASRLPEEGAGRVVGVELRSRERLYPAPSEERLRRVYMPMALVFGLVMLVACANVANLQLARASTRQREVSVRLSLGASRIRIVQQLLTESALLALTGALLGMLASVWLVQWALNDQVSLGGLQSQVLSLGIDEVHVNLHVLGYTLLVAFITSLASGLAPALQAASSGLVLIRGADNPTRRRSRRRLGVRDRLVVMQLVASLVLLIATTLLLRSAFNARNVDLGFDPANVLDLRMTPRLGRDDPQMRRLLAARLRLLPQVADVSLAYRFPAWSETRVVVQDQKPLRVYHNFVTPDFFQVLHLPLIAGRHFTAQEVASEAPVVIISRDAAAALLPGQDPIGKYIEIKDTSGAKGPQFKWARAGLVQVIGVTGSVGTVLRGGSLNAVKQIYLPTRPDDPALESLMVRTSGNAKDAMAAISREAAALDPDGVFEIQPLSDKLAAYLTPLQLLLTIVGSLGLLGLLLATVGLYGTISFSVVERTKEIGIRVALGARGHSIRWLVLSWALRLAISGAVIGVALAAVLSPLIAPYLYEVSSFDLLAFTAVPLFLIVVCLAAAFLPALRAARQDPMIALRHS
jgi:predicted permease